MTKVCTIKNIFWLNYTPIPSSVLNEIIRKDFIFYSIRIGKNRTRYLYIITTLLLHYAIKTIK